MADSTLANVLQKFPVGTVVGAYPAIVQGGTSNQPVGAKLAEATVAADGSLTFTGLTRKTPGQTLYAAAKVSSVWQTEQFTGPQGGTVVSEELAELESEVTVVTTTVAGKITAPVAYGTSGQQLLVRSDGTLKYTTPQEILLSAWGAAGDNATDDTVPVQNALNAAPEGAVVAGSPGALYKVKNLVMPNTQRLVFDGKGSSVISNGEGDSSYLIGTYNWVNNLEAPGEEGQTLRGLRILGSPTATLAGAKSNCVVAMSSRFKVLDCDVSRAAEVGVLLAATAKNGTTAVSGNIVENRIEGCRIHECGTFNVRTLDPGVNFRITDGFLRDNIVFNAGTSNIHFDKFSGWKAEGNHTYQLGSGLGGTVFTPGTNWDFDIEQMGGAGRVVNNEFESGCVRLKSFTTTWTGAVSGNHFGLTCPANAAVKIEASASAGEAAVVNLDNNIFYGPTTASNYCFLTLQGPASGAPMRVYITGGHFGFRTPISWGGQVKVFNKGVSVYQASHNLPTDLLVDGYMPTSGARPPGIVYRTAVPSGSEAFVVGDRWVQTTPVKEAAPGGVCITAGEPGTWKALASLGA